MRIGIIGCGQRIQTVVRNIAKNVDAIDIAFIAETKPRLFVDFARASEVD